MLNEWLAKTKLAEGREQLKSALRLASLEELAQRIRREGWLANRQNITAELT
jgi:hypothetical protein